MNATSEAIHLPAWWRYLLIGLAMLILCSCQAPPMPTGQVGDAPQEFALPPLEELPAEAPEESMMTMPMPMPPATAACMCDACNGCALVGPSDEYLCDGGDFGSPAGVRADWTINGLEQEDAVAHYDTLDGRVVVQPSNRVCIYAPRFAAVRRVVTPVVHERSRVIEVVADDLNLAETDEAKTPATSLQRHAVSINLGERPAGLLRTRQQAGEADNLQGVIDVLAVLAVQSHLTIEQTAEVSGQQLAAVERAVQAAITWSNDQAVQVVVDSRQAIAGVAVQQAGVVYKTDGPESPRLRLIKLASCGHARPGDEVEFALRFDNIGDQVMGNVTIVDNLTTRLGYVADSASSSLDADFSATPNGAGSDVLRWEIKAPLEAGEGGVLRFKCRVR